MPAAPQCGAFIPLRLAGSGNWQAVLSRGSLKPCTSKALLRSAVAADADPLVGA